jgi:transposase
VLSKHGKGSRNQLEIIALDDLVPADHLVRKIEDSIDFDFIYDLVEDYYCLDNGRPSVDPVVLIKMALIQYLFGIRSMRQTIKEIETNVAYRWFLGYGLTEKIPHFSTFGKNYVRRFQDTDLFEMIFDHILQEAIHHGFVNPEVIFIDSTHVKANANKKKYVKKLVRAQARTYQDQLEDEINQDRLAHGKKTLAPKTDVEVKEVKESTTDPESGYFVKNERERIFAYSFHTGCDRNGFVLGAIVEPSNVHDNQVFPSLYERIKTTVTQPTAVAVDAGYKTPYISKILLDDGVRPVMPYTRPQTKAGFFRKHEYVYDEYYDWYICPTGETLTYRTTTREGYRQYTSDPKICKDCPFLSQCTHSRNHTKQIHRHLWQDYLDEAEHLRHTEKNKQIYKQRKETIERVFADMKEKHGMRWTTLRGKRRIQMQAMLLFAAMNLKKLANWRWRNRRLRQFFRQLIRKTTSGQFSEAVFLQSESTISLLCSFPCHINSKRFLILCQQLFKLLRQ